MRECGASNFKTLQCEPKETSRSLITGESFILNTSDGPVRFVLKTRKGQSEKPLAERFSKFVNKTESCWLWNGALFNSGRGAFSYKGKKCLAPRISWLV